MIGSKLLDYEITRKIKAGGMGVVYEARRVWGKRERAAVKFLLEQLRDDDNIRRRFIREAEILEMLTHPRIVRILGLDPDRDAFVMEFVEGKTLAELLRTSPQTIRQPQVAVDMFAQLLDAFDYAHHVVIEISARQEQGVIHRDIKPSNIIIEPDGRPKILDFGISRISTFESTLTDPKLQMGSVAYMSPEQIVNPAGVDWRSDIYALGVNLWELFAGRPPYPQVTNFEAVIQVQNSIRFEPLPLLTDLHADSEADELAFLHRVDEVVARATAKDPLQRYQRCRDMRDALLATLLLAPAHSVAKSESTSAMQVNDVASGSVVSLEQPGRPARIISSPARQTEPLKERSTAHQPASRPINTGKVTEEIASEPPADLLPADKPKFTTRSESVVPPTNRWLLWMLVILFFGGGCFALWYCYRDLLQPASDSIKPLSPKVTKRSPNPASGRLQAPVTDTTKTKKSSGQLSTNTKSESTETDLTLYPTTAKNPITVIASNQDLDLEVICDESTRRGLRKIGGKEIFLPQFQEINLNGYEWGLIPVIMQGQQKFISRQGAIYSAKGMVSQTCNRVPVQKGKVWLYLDLNGHEINTHAYKKASAFDEATCTATVTDLKGRTYQIDKEENRRTIH